MKCNLKSKIEFLITLFILKTVEETSVILDGSYVTEPSTVWMGGKEEFKPALYNLINLLKNPPVN